MLKVYYQISRYNKDQSLKSKSRKRLSRSFVKQFLGCLYYVLSQNTGYAIKDVTLTDRTTSSLQYTIYAMCASHAGGISDFSAAEGASNILHNANQVGIIVGTGTGAVAITDAYMGTVVANGKGSGELEYLSCAVSDYTESDPNASFILERFFRNGSGDTVTINEVGVCCQSGYAGTTRSSFMIIRDLVSPAEDVADGEYLKITYTFQIEA